MAKAPQLNRKTLMVNQRRGITQHFGYNANIGAKSIAEPSIMPWAERGRGVQGESVNSQNNASKLIINKNWKPL
jgi:hypothetical protein